MRSTVHIPVHLARGYSSANDTKLRMLERASNHDK